MLVTESNIKMVLAVLHTRTELACDTETTGLEEHDYPFAVIFADAKDTYYFDERVVKFWNEPLFHILFLRSHVKLIFQNAKFDMRMLAMGFHKFAGKVLQWAEGSCSVCDIAVGARLMRNDLMSQEYRLNGQAMRYLKQRKDDAVEKHIKDFGLYEERVTMLGEVYKSPRFDMVPLEIMVKYGEKDARLTFDLYQIYMGSLSEESINLWQWENRLTKVCYKMERHGVLINMRFVQEAMLAEMTLCNELKTAWKAITGVDFVDSAKSLQKVVSVQFPETAKGNPSLDEDSLAGLLSEELSGTDRDLLEAVKKIRGYNYRISTYWKNYINKASGVNGTGVIHPSMWQAGTTTGRFSYSDPNFQNVPKEEASEDSPSGYIVREAIIPRLGETIVSLDYEQMEYKMMADYANEKQVIARVNAGEDFHAITAEMFGVTRKTAKTLNFALLYGAGVKKIAKMLSIDVIAARVLINKYFSALPNVEKFINNVVGTGKARGYIFNWAGRHLYADREFAYALPNYLIQGGGADVVKRAMVLINDEFPELCMFLQVHDQLVFSLKDYEMAYVPRIKEIMETVYEAKNGMKLTVSVSTSKNSLSELHLKDWVANEQF